MLIGEIISVALGALRANKLRSLLTMLGIVIGVGAVIAMVALGTWRAAGGEGPHRGARHHAAHRQTRASSAAAAGLAIGGDAAARSRSTTPRRSTSPRPRPARRAARDAIDRCRSSYGNKNTNTPIIGTTPNYLEVRKYAHAVGPDVHAPPTTTARRASPSRPAGGRQPRRRPPEALVGEDDPHRGIAVRRSSACMAPKGTGERVRIRTIRSSSRSRRRATA